MLIMKKAMEDLKLEAEKKVTQREEYLATKVQPLNLDGLSEKGKCCLVVFSRLKAIPLLLSLWVGQSV